MEKLKKYNVRLVYCPTCKGNGYLRVGTEEGEAIHQCWDCDSEGEFYVHQPKIYESNNTTHTDADNDGKLH
jgi:uncharacterized protein YbaR (Trm112 family)